MRTMLLLLALVLSISQKAFSVPCPFDTTCDCAGGDATSTIFQSVVCWLNSTNTVFPSFTTPINTYIIAGEFSIIATNPYSYYTTLPRSFSAFKSIGRLSLLSSRAWRGLTLDPLTFVGVWITDLKLIQFTGMIPPPAALSVLGQNGLESLSITTNSVTAIGPKSFQAFSDLVSLEIVSIANIGTIYDKAFSGLPSLKSLIIADSPITMINETAFSGLEENLAKLSLKATTITTYPTAALSGLINLRRLDLSENSMSAYPASAFSFVALEELRLTKNVLKPAIDSSAFDKFPLKEPNCSL